MTTRASPLTREDWAFGIGWVLATTVGWIVGFAICEAFKAFLESITADGAVIGTAVGIGQWLVLKGRINRVGWWILASIVGFGVGKAVVDAFGQDVSAPVGFILGGAVVGASLGIAQLLVLRRHVTQAERWVFASVLGWAVGGPFIRVAEETGGGPTGTAYAIGAAGAAAAGVITGLSLLWLLRLRPPGSEPTW